MGARVPPQGPGQPNHPPPVNPPNPGAGGRNVPQNPGGGGQGAPDGQPVGPQPDGDGDGEGPGGGLVPPVPGDGPPAPNGDPPIPDDGHVPPGDVPAPDAIPVIPGGGNGGPGLVPPVIPVIPDGGVPGAPPPVIPAPVVPAQPLHPIQPDVPAYPIVPAQPGGPAQPMAPLQPGDGGGNPGGVPGGGVVPDVPQNPGVGGPGGGVAPAAPGVPEGYPAVPNGGIYGYQPYNPYRPPADPGIYGLPPIYPDPMQRPNTAPQHPITYPLRPGQLPRYPGLPGQYPSPHTAGSGGHGGPDGPRYPNGAYNVPNGGMGAVPGAGVSGNGSIMDMVNNCMYRLSCALQSGQQRGPNVNPQGVWSGTQPANPNTAPDMNGYYYVNNNHVYGTTGGNLDPAHSVSGMNGRQTNRNPYVPGTMPHKMKAMGVPTKTIDQALEGDYVDLSDFLSPIGASNHVANPELEAVMDNSTNSISYRPKKYTRKIYNFDTWMQGWSNYEKLMVAHFGSNLHEYMSDYRTFIRESSNKYVWQAVSVYDFRHRTRLATLINISERLNFSTTFSDTNNTVLDTTAIRPNAPRCLRCKAYDHMVQDCPFPEIKPEGTKKKASQAQEICINYNREKCVTERCARKHICQKCRGNLPYAKCQLIGPCANRSAVTASS